MQSISAGIGGCSLPRRVRHVRRLLEIRFSRVARCCRPHDFPRNCNPGRCIVRNPRPPTLPPSTLPPSLLRTCCSPRRHAVRQLLPAHVSRGIMGNPPGCPGGIADGRAQLLRRHARYWFRHGYDAPARGLRLAAAHPPALSRCSCRVSCDPPVSALHMGHCPGSSRGRGLPGGSAFIWKQSLSRCS